MAKVYLSSTVADLAAERQAVIDWLIQDGHEPVHGYVGDGETVREGCLDEIDGCELYVLILGYRYGHIPEDDNPEDLSITQLEFRRAGSIGVPRIALVTTQVPRVHLTDLLDPGRNVWVQDFHAEVRQAVCLVEFGDLTSLLAGLSTSVHRELARCRGVAPQVLPGDPAVRHIVAKLMRQLDKAAGIAAVRMQLRERNAQLAAAIARILTTAAEVEAAPLALKAARALGAGDTRPAEDLLQEQERALTGPPGQTPPEGLATARQLAAELAREQGALAATHDVRAALVAYERAADLDPEDTWTHFVIGDIWFALGNPEQACAHYTITTEIVAQRLATVPEDLTAQQDLAIGYGKIGGVLNAHGDLHGALAALRESLGIREHLAARDGATSHWQRDLSISHERIGDVLAAQGDAPGALAAFRKTLEIAETLAARETANTQWQHDLSIVHGKIGGVLVTQGDLGGALTAFHDSLVIREQLAASDSANTRWQRDLSISLGKLGGVLVARGDLAGALAAFRQGLEIREQLVARGTANPQWQRDLSISHQKVGDVLVALGDRGGALTAFRRALGIAEALATRDGADAQWQIDVALLCSKLGTHAGLSAEERQSYLIRGRDLLVALKSAGRLASSQDWVDWFDEELQAQEHDDTSGIAA